MTQSLAQKLYEGLEVNGEHVGLITYMRTDSTRLSDNFYYNHAKPFILETFGDEYLGNVKFGKKQERIQDAHEAIRPTGTHRTPEIVAKFVGEREAKLYKLIYDRALASVMSDKVEEVTTVIFEENGLSFKTVGTRTLFKGYEAIYGEFEDDDTKLLPLIEDNGIYKRVETKNEQKFTKAPARYTEARVVKMMEEKGIGRPSTYASTIKLLIAHGYVTSKGGVLTPTETGTRTTLVMEDCFPAIVSFDYTAKMESQLDEIEEGKLKKLDAMNSFYGPFIKDLEVATERIGKREMMYQKTKEGWKPDNFSHEQSLVFETDKGLVIINSCSHGGAVNIINEVKKTFPDKHIYGLVGGFHLFNKTEGEIRKVSRNILDTGIDYVCTGHCTKDRAYSIMKEELGDKLEQLRVGLVIEF